MSKKLQDPEEINSEDVGNMATVKAAKKRKLVNRDTLPLKVTQFFFYGAMASILPYLTVHMQDIGISIQEVAIIYAVLPFTSFMGPPVMGFLADKFGQYKWVLIVATFMSGVFNSSLLLVPRYRPETLNNAQIVFHWRGSSNEGVLYSGLGEHCPAFVNFTSTMNSVNIQHLECILPNNNHSETRTYSTKSEASNFQDFIEFITGNRPDSVEGKDSKGLPLTFEYREGCRIRITSPYLLKIGKISQNINCTTDISFPVGKVEKVGSQAVTFWVYFLLRLASTICLSSCFSLLDATVLAVVKKSSEAEYGKERIWSIIGLSITSPLAGILVDRVSAAKGFTDYAPAFYLSNALLLCNIAAYFLIKLDVEKPGKGIMKNGMKLLKYPEVVVFLIMIFVLGSLWGFVESYLFVFLKDLNAPNYLLGLTLTVGSLVGVPFLWGAEKIVAKIGRVNLIILAFFTYFVRFFGYSYLQNPFWCFPFEAMEAFTYHLMWTAAATYCGMLAPKGLLASMTGIMGSLHYGLGKGAGSFMGGYLYGAFGARLTFRYFGVAAGIFGIIFMVLNFFWIRKVVKRRVQEKLEDEKLAEARELQTLTGNETGYLGARSPSMVPAADPVDNDMIDKELRPPRERRASHVMLSSSYTSLSPIDYS